MKNIKSFVKRLLFYSKFKYVGKNAFIDKTCKGFLKNVSVGHNSYIGLNAHFNCCLAEVKIGNYVCIADDVLFITGNHKTDVIGEYIINNIKTPADNDLDKTIVVEDDVWIGSRVIILKGITIGKGSIVGAGSVVTKNIPPYSVFCGNPAKEIRKRFSIEQIKKHERIIKDKYE